MVWNEKWCAENLQRRKIDVSTTYKDDIKNGQHIEYYNDETGKLQLKLIENI